jgi:hypothetical protein
MLTVKRYMYLRESPAPTRSPFSNAKPLPYYMKLGIGIVRTVMCNGFLSPKQSVLLPC